MSGGDLFNYREQRIHEMIYDLEDCLPNTHDHVYSEKTINEFKTGLKYLELAFIYAHRMDYLVSSDDSESEFHERLKYDLKCIGGCSQHSGSRCSVCGQQPLIQISESDK